MDTPTLLLFLAGLVLLLVGAEALVRGSATLAERVGISPLVVGLTVVAFGTSSPELAVTIQSALGGQADIALGNVVGSNIFNVLFILGISALVVPLAVQAQLIRVDVPLMIGVSALVWLMASGGSVSRWEGAVLVAGLAAYTAAQLRAGRRAPSPGPGDPPPPGVPPPEQARSASILLQVVLVLGGLGLLVLGSRWLVEGAVELAGSLGVGERVVGLTIVAAGTSLPEVATSLVAAIRGQRDIAVGNVVGSNIFNLTGVLGAAALLAADGVAVGDAALLLDLPVMTGVAVACLPVFFTGLVIARWEGVVFLGYYMAYTAYLVLRAQDHPTLPLLGNVIIFFALPLTAFILGAVAVRELRRGREGPWTRPSSSRHL